MTTLPLDVTTAEMQAYSLPGTVFDAPILQGGLSLRDMESHDPNNLHVVFIEAPPLTRQGPTTIICGVAYGSGVAIVFAGYEELPLAFPHCNFLSLVFLHEVFHLLGAVHPDVPHSDGSHINIAPWDEDGQPLPGSGLPWRWDLMRADGAVPEAELDIGSDDYYFHPEKTPHWPPPHYDTVDSPYFTAGPWTDITRAVPSQALWAAPPEGQPAIAPDNPSEAAPYPALPEPRLEEQGGRVSGGWCGGVVD